MKMHTNNSRLQSTMLPQKDTSSNIMLRKSLNLWFLGMAIAVSAKYEGLTDNSSENWFGHIKVGIGPVKKIAIF